MADDLINRAYVMKPLETETEGQCSEGFWVGERMDL